MHATFEQLLSIRDAMPVAADVLGHAGDCPVCRTRLLELQRVREQLRTLPQAAPVEDRWRAIRKRAQHARDAYLHRRRIHHAGGLAVAATAVLAAVLVLNQTDERPGVINRPGVAETVAGIPAPAATHAAPAGIDDGYHPADAPATGYTFPDAELDALISQSASLEGALHALPRRPRVVRVGTTDLINGLQDGVALIDYQLTSAAGSLSPRESRRLWRKRVDILNSLVSVRYAETLNVSYHPD